MIYVTQGFEQGFTEAIQIDINWFWQNHISFFIGLQRAFNFIIEETITRFSQHTFKEPKETSFNSLFWWMKRSKSKGDSVYNYKHRQTAKFPNWRTWAGKSYSNSEWNDWLLNFLQMIFMNVSVLLDFVSALKTKKGFIIMTRHM